MKIESIVRAPSLEFSWLPNSLIKSLPTPQVRFVSGSDRGGAYYRVQNHDSDFANLKTRPIIEIDVDCGDIQSTIAHEFRHHYQTYNIGIPTVTSWGVPDGWSYRDAIVNYFLSSWSEMDALMFECSVAPSDVNMQWMEWVMGSR